MWLSLALCSFPDLGHFGPLQQPEVVAAAVKEALLKDLQGRGRGSSAEQVPQAEQQEEEGGRRRRVGGGAAAGRTDDDGRGGRRATGADGSSGGGGGSGGFLGGTGGVLRPAPLPRRSRL